MEYTPAPLATNSDLRSRATYTLRQHLERIIMLNLAVYAATLIFSGAGLMSSLSGILSGISSNMDEDEVIASLFSGMGTSSVISILSTLASYVLSTGFLYGLILLCSGTVVKASVLICRWKHALGCIGLKLWTSVKTMFWAIPGYLGVILGSGIISASQTARLVAREKAYDLAYEAFYDLPYSTRRYMSSPSYSDVSISPIYTILTVFGALVVVAGVVAIAFFVIPAALRFAMAPYVFAESPEVGVYESVEISKSLMNGNKGRLFRLTIPYYLLMAGVIAGSILLCVIIGLIYAPLLTIFAPIALIFVFIAVYYLGLLAQVSMAHFYVDLKTRA